MKKVLFATTALVAFAGAAAAEVTVSGSAEMGIAGGSIDGAADINTTFFQSVDVRFTMTGTADNGLSFGATVDLNDASEQGDVVDIAGDFADFTVFISGQFGTLTMGDTDGAFDWALEDMGIGNPGTLGDDETIHAGYNGNGFFDGAAFGAYNGQVLRYNYSIGDFGIAVSAQVDGDDGRDGDPQIQIGANYGFGFAGGTAGVGLGYVTVSDANRFVDFNNAGGPPLPGDQGYSAVGLSLHVELDSGFSGAFNYTDIDDDGYFGADGEHIGVGFGYTVDAITVHVNYGEFDWAPAAFVEDSDGYGIAASYDFGGGLSAHLGYGNSDFGALNNALAATPDFSTWSFGLAMSF